MLENKLFIIYCICDDFCKLFEPLWNKNLLSSGLKTRLRSSSLSTAEIVTINIAFHQSGYRNFKSFYRHILHYHKKEFPNLVSYNRFTEFKKKVLIPTFMFAHFLCGECSGISFIDSTSLSVCKNKRIFNHKVFAGVAERGKNSMGFFFGFKLHLLINQYGHIINFEITKGNVGDRAPVFKMMTGVFGKIYGDKGYLGKEFCKKIWEDFQVLIITHLKRNMNSKALMSGEDIKNLKGRSCIETVNNMLKNSGFLEHSRHRSGCNFLENIFSCISSFNIKFVSLFQNWLGVKPPILLSI